jgi:hypothetical protein
MSGFGLLFQPVYCCFSLCIAVIYHVIHYNRTIMMTERQDRVPMTNTTSENIITTPTTMSNPILYVSMTNHTCIIVLVKALKIIIQTKVPSQIL